MKVVNNFQENEELVHTALQRRQELTDLLEGYRIGMAMEIASGYTWQQDPDNDHSWNSSRGYHKIYSALLSFLPLSNQRYQELIGPIKEKLESSQRTYEGLEEAAELLGKEMRDQRIFQGISMAEIGGTVLNKIFTPLEVSVEYADAGMSFCNTPADWDKLIDLDNYKAAFRIQSDFTVSNFLFGPAYDPYIPIDLDRLTSAGIFAEMFAIFSNITILGGCSIHAPVTRKLRKEFFDYVGFDFVYAEGKYQKRDALHKENWDDPKKFGDIYLLILRKTEPKPELFPDGVVLGFDSEDRTYRVIEYDPEKKEFFAKSLSYEDYSQMVRRCYRLGSQPPKWLNLMTRLI